MTIFTISMACGIGRRRRVNSLYILVFSSFLSFSLIVKQDLVNSRPLDFLLISDQNHVDGIANDNNDNEQQHCQYVDIVTSRDYEETIVIPCRPTLHPTLPSTSFHAAGTYRKTNS